MKKSRELPSELQPLLKRQRRAEEAHVASPVSVSSKKPRVPRKAAFHIKPVWRRCPFYDQCKLEYSSSTGLRHHLDANHLEEQQGTSWEMPIFDYSCSFCNRSFSQKSNLVTHINAIHSSEFEEHQSHMVSYSDSGTDTDYQDENVYAQVPAERPEAMYGIQNEEEWRTLREIGNIMLALTEDPDVSFAAAKEAVKL